MLKAIIAKIYLNLDMSKILFSLLLIFKFILEFLTF